MMMNDSFDKQFHGSLHHFEDEDFNAIVYWNSMNPDAMRTTNDPTSEAVRGILDGDSYDNYDTEILEFIAGIAYEKGETDLADSINSFLENAYNDDTEDSEFEI